MAAYNHLKKKTKQKTPVPRDPLPFSEDPILCLLTSKGTKHIHDIDINASDIPIHIKKKERKKLSEKQ